MIPPVISAIRLKENCPGLDRVARMAKGRKRPFSTGSGRPKSDIASASNKSAPFSP